MPPGRGLHRGPGPWSPQLQLPSGRDSYNPQSGPSTLDVQCKAALHQVLKPSHYGVIVPWMRSVGTEAKRDMVNLGRHASGASVEHEDPVHTFAASRETAILNPNGRPKLAKAVHVTADRAQSDMLRNRSGAEQRDTGRESSRRFFSNFHPIPNRDTVADFYRLGDVPIASDSTTQVLTEHARRKLHQWQVRGPEGSKEGSAQVMRSLRSLSSACERVPKYSDAVAVFRPSDPKEAGTFLHEYAMAVPKGHKSLRAPLQHARSAPAIIPKPLFDPEEIEGISRPGGDRVDHFDSAPIQKMKNHERAMKSKISMAGGNVDWSTSNQVIGATFRRY